jgi:hypothetical protein
MPIAAGSRPAATAAHGRLLHDRPRLVQLRARRHLREPAVSELPGPDVRTLRLPADPYRDRPLHRQRTQPGRGHGLVGPGERHRLLGPQPAQQGDLLRHPPAAVGERLAERLVLHRVPAESDAEPELAAGQQVDLGGLLGDEGGLSLRQDDDAGDQLQRRQRGQVAEHDQRLVERRVDVVRAIPGRVHGGVGAQHMVVGQQVGVPELLHPLSVGAHRARVATEFGLREDNSDIHKSLFYRPAS